MRQVVYVVVWLLLPACSGGGGNEKPVALEPLSFIERTKELAGPDALDCGDLAIGAPVAGINRCVSDAFLAYQPFYAIYRRQGIDSNVATGFAYNSMDLYFVEFDDFSCMPAGDCAQYYRVLECISPTVNEPDSEPAAAGNPFSCSDWLEAP
jgi:hypothetical protein